MSIQNTMKKVTKLILEIKQCLQTKNAILPLKRYKREFSIQHRKILPTNQVNIIFSKKSVTLLLRLVQILLICGNLLVQNRYNTKRNLYYKLIKHYQNYSSIDDDILILTDTLKLERYQLNILTSNKLQLFFYVPLHKRDQVYIQLSYKKFITNDDLRNDNNNVVQQHKMVIQQYPKKQYASKQSIQSKQSKYSKGSQQSQQIVFHKAKVLLKPNQKLKVPNCPKLFFEKLVIRNGQGNVQKDQKTESKCQKNEQEYQKINILIVQKQSIYESLCESLSYKGTNNKSWLLVTSKGYPDQLTLQFLSQLTLKLPSNLYQIYYLGDSDIYGFDIMLNYAIGTQNYSGLIPKLKWFGMLYQLLKTKGQKGFIKNFMKDECRQFSHEDYKKLKEISNRKYFQSIQPMLHSHNTEIVSFANKMHKWKLVFQQLVDNGLNCELESFFKYFSDPFEMIELMIDKQLYC